MQGLKLLKEALERHRETKDINVRFKTPLTGMSAQFPQPQLHLTFISAKHKYTGRRSSH